MEISSGAPTTPFLFIMRPYAPKCFVQDHKVYYIGPPTPYHRINPFIPSKPIDKTRKGFLNLPMELRLQIYKLCIPQKETVNVLVPRIKFEAKGLLFVSQQISKECLDILYGENTFELPLNAEGEAYLCINFAPLNRERMRHLAITAVPIGKTYTRSTPNQFLWASLLPRVKTLEMVMAAPIPPLTSLIGPPPPAVWERWYDWLLPYLMCFKHHLPSSAKVKLDVDDRRFAVFFMRPFVPPSWRIVRLERGDLIFLRGEYRKAAKELWKAIGHC